VEIRYERDQLSPFAPRKEKACHLRNLSIASRGLPFPFAERKATMCEIIDHIATPARTILKDRLSG